MSMIGFYIGSIQFFMHLLFLCLIILFAINWKTLLAQFKKLRRMTVVSLILIFLLGLILRMFVFPQSHLLYIDEPWSMESAKNMLRLGKPLLCEYSDYDQATCEVYPKSIGWPFLMEVAFQIFGINNWVALYLSAMLGSVSVLLIFFLGYLLFQKEDVGLWSALLMALYPLHILWSTTAETVVPALFFVLATLLFFLIYFRTQKSKMLLLAVVALVFTIQLRIEYLLLVLVMCIMFILFDKALRKKVQSRKFWVPFLVLLAASVIYIPQLMLQHNSQKEIYSQPYVQANFFIDHFFFAVKAVILDFNFLFISLIILGMVVCYLKDKRTFLFLLSLSLIFFVFYLSFIKLQQRMLLLPASSLIIAASLGLSSIVRMVTRKIPRKTVTVVLIFIIVLVFAMGIQRIKRIDRSAYVLETKIPELVEEQISNECYVVTEWPTVLTSTTDLKVVSTRTVVKNPIVLRNILDRTGCVLYFEEGFCLRIPIAEPLGSQQRCAEIRNRYDLEPYVRFREKDKVYTFYKVSLRE